MVSVISEVFNKAAETLGSDDIQWRQGSSHLVLPNGLKTRCAGEVIEELCGSKLSYYDCNDFFFGKMGHSITTWNDFPGRTKEEVIEKLKEMAEKAREEGL